MMIERENLTIKVKEERLLKLNLEWKQFFFDHKVTVRTTIKRKKDKEISEAPCNT